MTNVPKVSRTRSVWMYRATAVTGVLVASPHELASCEADNIGYYTTEPHLLTGEVLKDIRLQVIVSPTPSPFSHDANLIRAFASERAISAVCGIDLQAERLHTPASFALVEHPAAIIINGSRFAASRGLAGSDEATAYLLSGAAICYRPFYLYDDWLARRIAAGLEYGVGRHVGGDSAKARIDSAGRVWLVNGPSPARLAEWMLASKKFALLMLTSLVDALGALELTQWEPSAVLQDREFLKELDVNFLVAPFVGFPLYSLTKIVTNDRRIVGDHTRLEARVADLSPLVPIVDRQLGQLTKESVRAVRSFLTSLEEREDDLSDIDLAAAVILISDMRRIVIDNLRRAYPIFREHTRHRSLG